MGGLGGWLAGIAKGRGTGYRPEAGREGFSRPSFGVLFRIANLHYPPFLPFIDDWNRLIRCVGARPQSVAPIRTFV